MIFWKEAWLKRVPTATVTVTEFAGPSSSPSVGGPQLHRIWQAAEIKNAEGDSVYSCQATDVLKFTSPLAIWDPRQYFRDVRSGNISTCLAGTSRSGTALDMTLAVVELMRAFVIGIYNRLQAFRDGVHYPQIRVGQAEKMPVEDLNLQPGDLVEVRAKEEIIATLDKRSRNRGLSFDSEMLRYCGGIYRVFRRVRHIVDEKTGRMLYMKHPCIILEGVWCRSDYHRFCPRAIFHYWRESWLKRAELQSCATPGMEEVQIPCEKR